MKVISPTIKDSLLLFCVLIFFSGSISAQKYPTKNNNEYSVTGIIKDQPTGEALPFASVLIKGTNIGVSANADGYFTITKIPSDTSTLIFQYLGYSQLKIKLNGELFKSQLKVEMEPSSLALNEVSITATREDVVLVDRNNVSTIKMTPKKLEQLPNFGEKDILRSFQLMPGISASNESSSGLYVRGGTPDQNLVLYDGFTVYHVDHLYGFYSAFNANALKDVQLYKSSFESRFGGRLSSVTEITGKEGNQKEFNVGADISLLSFNAFAEIPIGEKFSSIIAFRRSYKGPLYNQIFSMFNTGSSSSSEGKPGESGSSTVASYFYDLNGKFTYRPTKKDIISLSIYNGTDHLDNSSEGKADAAANASISASSTDLTNYGNIGSSLKWSRKWSDNLYGNTLISYSNYYSTRDNSQSKSLTDSTGIIQTSSQGLFENNDLNDFSIKSDYQLDLKNNRQLQFGVFGTYHDIDYNYAQNDSITIVNKQNKATIAGGYLQSRIRFLNDKLLFLPGIRSTYYTETGKVYFEPRASLTYNLNSNITLRAATGKYYQFANRVSREDILSGSRDFWLLSDDVSIPVSSSIHYTSGIAYENNDYLFSVEGYYKQLKNITEYSLRFNPQPQGPGINYSENFFSGYGDAKGIEFLAQKKSGKINGWISYTLGQARNHFDIYSDNYFPANQDVTNEFKVVGIYKLKRWDFAATWIFATGRPYTAPSGAYSVTLLDDSTQNFYTVTNKNGQRLPDYHRADVSINYKFFANNKNRELGYIGLSVFNVYNRTNTWYKQYTIINGQIIQNNVNYLGITPNLTLSFKLR